MSTLTKEQQARAIEVMSLFLTAPAGKDGKTPVQQDQELDANRSALIKSTLLPLLGKYLEGKVTYEDFKTQIDGLNKRNPFWGFRGMKGQMFFNMVTNVAANTDEVDQELKAAIRVPENLELAASRIRTFVSFVKRLGESHVESGGSARSCPNSSSVPYFLSYFWQIQDHEKWPIFYTNSVSVMEDLFLLTPSGDAGADYVAYAATQFELMKLFQGAARRAFSLWDVEHVFWYRGQQKNEQPVPEPIGPKPPTKAEILPDSFVPPIIEVLPRIALNEPVLQEAAKRSGTSLDRAFEKAVHAAFTVMGYDAKLMGQGQGRVPDGIAVDADSSFAIIWDAKVRTDGYSIGTDDRTIREYISTQSREIKNRKRFRNIYYVIVSSSFREDYEEAIRALKMETDVNEVCLMEASALVAMVDLKLRSPLDISLGSDGFQRLFANSGVLTAEMVRELIG